eukprot:CAMPEP_0179169304 /NCGR_PEP_ID=MMETSP0796-20121207/83319_1 /TAXON_ID=73915 /ORGANISM="Pyrodinium bahamense, Strain pbaha01" /LENGTH=169 /DNA_ID=CAMNT_0020872127 /DNA_START=152 /DNA_END=657 /DNA_ORIENTATION=+
MTPSMGRDEQCGSRNVTTLSLPCDRAGPPAGDRPQHQRSDWLPSWDGKTNPEFRGTPQIWSSSQVTGYPWGLALVDSTTLLKCVADDVPSFSCRFSLRPSQPFSGDFAYSGLRAYTRSVQCCCASIISDAHFCGVGGVREHATHSADRDLAGAVLAADAFLGAVVGAAA